MELPQPAGGVPGLLARQPVAEPGLFVNGRDEIVAFLTQKWERELDYA